MNDNQALAHDLARLRAGKLPAVVLTAAALSLDKGVVVSVHHRGDAPQLALSISGWAKDAEVGRLFPVEDPTALGLALAMAEKVIGTTEARPEGEAVALCEVGAYRMLAKAGGQRWAMIADLEAVARDAPAVLSVPASDLGRVAEAMALAERRLGETQMLDGIGGPLN